MDAAWQKEKVAELNSSDLRDIVVAHTGHSSQLFPVATGRNAQFLSTVAGSALVWVSRFHVAASKRALSCAVRID
jgi:hypothetical protein